jgi:G8 domain-containing protein
MARRRSDQGPRVHEQPGMGRRDFLRVTGIAGTAALASGAVQLVGPMLSKAAAQGAALWSKPDTWGTGGIPGRATNVVITKRVLLDVDATVAGVRIEPGGELIFDPNASRTLESLGNVENRGRLELRPGSPKVIHRLVFIGVREQSFKGGGMSPVASDVGLWTVDGGILDITGSPKLAWTRAAGGIDVGARTITLSSDPSGWRVGDEIVLTPTVSPAILNHSLAYDTATISAISGRTITLSVATTYAHPAVPVTPDKILTAEVLNLTRNVRIEGTASGRAHVFCRSTQAQTIRHAAIRYMGPRQASGNDTVDVLGRYGLHFHHSYNGSAGSLVEGVVVRNAGSHAFAPHLSHGITLRGCISHDTLETAYWWDRGHADQNFEDQGPNDVVIDRCVASMVKTRRTDLHRVAGFWMGAGLRSTAKHCVAVGVQGASNASGFNWPDASKGNWLFQDCVAHNNKVDGIFVWQKNNEVHVVSRFIAYHNGKAGIEHGAYKNSFRYEDTVLYGNADSAIIFVAVSGSVAPLSFVRVTCDGAGLPAYAVHAVLHEVDAPQPAQFVGCTFKGYQTAALAFGPNNPQRQHFSADIIDCTFQGNEFWLGSNIPSTSLIRVQDNLHGALQLRQKDQPGVYTPWWNASVTPSEPFS